MFRSPRAPSSSHNVSRAPGIPIRAVRRRLSYLEYFAAAALDDRYLRYE
jgi:hypothetical protein